MELVLRLEGLLGGRALFLLLFEVVGLGDLGPGGHGRDLLICQGILLLSLFLPETFSAALQMLRHFLAWEALLSSSSHQENGNEVSWNSGER